MKHARSGSSGLHVSRIALGCMSFGEASRGIVEEPYTPRMPTGFA